MKLSAPLFAATSVVLLLVAACGDNQITSDPPMDSPEPTTPGEPPPAPDAPPPGGPAPDPIRLTAEQAAAAHELTTDLHHLLVNFTPAFSSANVVTQVAFGGGIEGLLLNNVVDADCVTVEKADAITLTFAMCDVHGVELNGVVVIDVDIDLPTASAALTGGTEELVIGSNTVVGSFEATASLLERTISWTSTLEVTSDALAGAFSHSVESETRLDGGVLVTNSEVEYGDTLLDAPLSLTLTDVGFDLVARAAALDYGLCPDAGTVTVAAGPGLTGEMVFNGDGTVAITVNGTTIDRAPEPCVLADLYIGLLAGSAGAP